MNNKDKYQKYMNIMHNLIYNEILESELNQLICHEYEHAHQA